MTIAPQADIALATRLFAALEAMNETGPGMTRDAYGEGEERAHRLVRAEAEALGLSCATDAAGNLYMTLAGSDAALHPWIVGSHLDTVPHGGNFDGAAGVLAGLAAIAGLKRAGLAPRRTITVMAIRAEESTWFPVSYIGSRAAFGRLDAATLDLPRVDTGRSLAAHMAALGFDPEAVRAGQAHLRPGAIHGFIELHIEQGPRLEGEGVPVGLVTGITGSFRYRRGVCFGNYGHSGAVPRGHRQDAVMAFADLAMELDRRWAAMDAAGDQLTITFGEVATDPSMHAFSKVPGEVRFCLDVRSDRQDLLDRLHAILMETAGEIERRRGVRFAFGDRTGSTPALMDRRLRAAIEAAAQASGIPTLTMPSGAGHDAATFAHAGVPAAMIFIRNQNGSHNPDEAMRMEDFAAAATLLARVLGGEP
ncbi:Zn-dependent hydrolase [Labrys monachus]|uniref:N-carbamoyl-L-amino-acid hydrolase n=1 Tax=Labrys monachus TaxID=217067 RepID=A0ABU0FH02_9HYPH|nr:Zn-dependent hydrolase [Labrys monachus]MDQ0393877.1 N-carbamoyl-L-amino-acid hydrolase [Labrys monachus]